MTSRAAILGVVKVYEEDSARGLARWPLATFTLASGTLLELVAWVGVSESGLLEGLAAIPLVFGGWLVMFFTALGVVVGELRSMSRDRWARDGGEVLEPRGRGLVFGGLLLVLALNVLFVALWAK